jgi:hypothetical protein
MKLLAVGLHLVIVSALGIVAAVIFAVHALQGEFDATAGIFALLLHLYACTLRDEAERLRAAKD